MEDQTIQASLRVAQVFAIKKICAAYVQTQLADCLLHRSEGPMSNLYNSSASSPYKQDSFALANSKASSNLLQVASRLATRYSPIAVVLLLCYTFLLDRPSCDVSAAAPATGFRAAIAERMRGHRDVLNAAATEQDLPDATQLANLALTAPIPQKPYKLVMCTRIWNEAKYLDEWICGLYHCSAETSADPSAVYHYLLGFDHFML